MSHSKKSPAARARRHRNLRNRTLQLEGLENRSLMAANITATLNTANHILYVQGTNVADTIQIRNTAGKFSIAGVPIKVTDGANVSTVSQVSRSQITRVEVHSLGGADTISVTEKSLAAGQAAPLFAFGGDGNDKITGGRGNDRLYGGNGSDEIYGKAGHDELRGAYKSTSVETGGGADQLYGGTGNDTAYGDDGNDRVVGEDGNDTIYGGNGEDELIGCHYGWAGEVGGDDKVYGGAGNDSLYGGDGNDLMAGEDGDDYLTGEKGEDTLIGCFYGWAGEVSGNDKIYGGPGNDSLYGGDGNDRMAGEDGDDFLTGEKGADILIGCHDGWAGEVSGNDKIYGGPGNDELYGGDGNDRMAGEDGDDFLTGEKGNDILIGCHDGWAGEVSGNDRVFGGPGNDELYGGDGNDLMAGEDGDDYLTGEKGEDELIGCHYGWAGEVSGNDRIFGGPDNDRLYGGDGNDLMAGEDGDDFLTGEKGDDTLIGCFYGWAGEVSGNDRIFGGPGNDSLYGGDGNDRMAGEDGDDFLTGERGNDVLIGAFDGWAGEVSGNDRIFGGDNDDYLYGGDGDDTLYGEAGNDTLIAENGNDNLYGGDHDDLLFGGNGLDGLYGGMGVNQLRGEGGPDRFLLFSPGDNPVDKVAEDAIVRFFNTNSRNSTTTSGVPGTMYWEAGFWNDNEIITVDGGLRWLHMLTGNTRMLKTSGGGELSYERWGNYVFDPNGNGIDANEAATNMQGQNFTAWNRGSGRMAFTQACMSDTAQNIAITVIHEDAHNFDDESNVWSRWLAASGWHTPQPGESTFSFTSGDGAWRYDVLADNSFYRDYSRWNPYEDWTTTFEAYYLNSMGSLDAAAAKRLSYKFTLINDFVASMR